MSENIQCMVCAIDLPNLAYEYSKTPELNIHPNYGLHFRTYGHYGSCIFDPMGTGEYLDVAICDVCIMAHLDKVRGSGKVELADNAQLYTDAATSNAARRKAALGE
jgi:hypothetical protein